MGPDAWPINLRSWCMTHHPWVLTHDQNWVRTHDPLVLGQKKIMVTQLLNNIKKNSHQFISFLLYEKKLHERKEKQLKALGLARGRTHRWWVLLETGPTLMGSPRNRTQGCWVHPSLEPKLFWVLLGAGPNSNGSYWAGPHLIYSYWGQDPTRVGPNTGPKRMGS